MIFLILLCINVAEVPISRVVALSIYFVRMRDSQDSPLTLYEVTSVSAVNTIFSDP